MENTALSRTNGTQHPARQETGMERVKNYILSPEVKARFTEMMGRNAMYYLNQVLIVVSNSSALQKCNPKSILVAAMRAASLKLSVDPVKGQAWIIPYNGEATFQLGYKGVWELAMRTHEYRFINVIDIFEGEEIVKDRFTGMHDIKGKRTGDKVIAWMLYFELRDGFKKTFPMTIEEIHDHAAHYSPSYKNPKSVWHDERERPKMEKKTVLSNGLRAYGRFNEEDKELLDEIEEAQSWTRYTLPDEDLVSVTIEEPRTPESILGDLGFEPGKTAVRDKVILPMDYIDPMHKAIPVATENSATAETPATPPARPLAPAILKDILARKAERNHKGKNASREQIGLAAMLLNKCFIGQNQTDKIRHTVLAYLTGSESLNNCPGPLVLALLDWLNPDKDSGGDYQPDSMAVTEASSVFTAALEAAGQQSLL